MTPKQVAKIQVLRAKLAAGLPVKNSDWPAWQSAAANAGSAALRFTADHPASNPWHHESAARNAYFTAIGKGENEVHPASISWDAYREREREAKS